MNHIGVEAIFLQLWSHSSISDSRGAAVAAPEEPPELFSDAEFILWGGGQADEPMGRCNSVYCIFSCATSNHTHSQWQSSDLGLSAGRFCKSDAPPQSTQLDVFPPQLFHLLVVSPPAISPSTSPLHADSPPSERRATQCCKIDSFTPLSNRPFPW